MRIKVYDLTKEHRCNFTIDNGTICGLKAVQVAVIDGKEKVLCGCRKHKFTRQEIDEK